MTENIVQRLRSPRYDPSSTVQAIQWGLPEEAADEIERLQAENERLRDLIYGIGKGRDSKDD